MTLRRVLQFPLRLWHGYISPVLPPMCRFHPSCSVYAIEALERFPVRRALWLIVKRVVKCQPLHPGGFDPVPEAEGGAADGVDRSGSHACGCAGSHEDAGANRAEEFSTRGSHAMTPPSGRERSHGY
jgi:hypothetical protein